MNGYVEAGYVVILGTLGTYAVTLVARERATRRRIDGAPTTAQGPSREAADTSALPQLGAEEPGPRLS